MTVARHIVAGLVGLGIVGAAFGAVALHAQCAPSVQRLITDRQYDEARAELQAQLKRAPNDDAAMDCMGRLRLEQGESGDAVDWLEKAVKINGQSAQHHQWLGTALRAEAPKANMLRAPQLNPMRGHLDYAMLAEHDNDYAGAAKEYLAALRHKRPPESGTRLHQQPEGVRSRREGGAGLAGQPAEEYLEHERRDRALLPGRRSPAERSPRIRNTKTRRRPSPP